MLNRTNNQTNIGRNVEYKEIIGAWLSDNADSISEFGLRSPLRKGCDEVIYLIDLESPRLRSRLYIFNNGIIDFDAFRIDLGRELVVNSGNCTDLKANLDEVFSYLAEFHRDDIHLNEARLHEISSPSETMEFSSREKQPEHKFSMKDRVVGTIGLALLILAYVNDWRYHFGFAGLSSTQISTIVTMVVGIGFYAAYNSRFS